MHLIISKLLNLSLVLSDFMMSNVKFIKNQIWKKKFRKLQRYKMKNDLVLVHKVEKRWKKNKKNRICLLGILVLIMTSIIEDSSALSQHSKED